jgi:subtilase family serine protease
MARRVICAVSAGAILFLVFSSFHRVHAQRRTLITQAVDERRLMALRGNTRPEATAANDRGRVADELPMEHMLLALRRAPETEQALEALIERQHDPASSDFHHWLTPAEFGAQYGPAPEDLDAIAGWLRGHGFRVDVIYDAGTSIDFSGTAGEVREAFHTEIHHLEVNGRRHIANMSDPQIPAALVPAVAGIVSLHDFMPHDELRVHTAYTVSSSTHLVVPGDLATMYNLNPLFAAGISGQGQTIVVLEDSDVYSQADFDRFRKVFGLSTSYFQGSFSQVHPTPASGGQNCSDPGVTAADGEAILDAEWASAAAPNAAIVLASCSDSTTTFGGFIALQNLLAKTPPAIVSISYGDAETDMGAAANAFVKGLYQTAVIMGTSIFVATGDEGAASYDANASTAQHGIGVSGFASTPYNVAVGGTDFEDVYLGKSTAYWGSTNTATYASALSYIPEMPWNDSCASSIISHYLGFTQTYGSTGFCNNSSGARFLTTVSASGGPSGCASGAPFVTGVVGGTCAGYAKPSWQAGFKGIQSDGVRDIPDVSLFAANGVWGHYYVVCYSDMSRQGGASCLQAPNAWSGFGGTSVSTPIMAGIQALINQKNGGPNGNPNPVLYKLAASEYGANGNASCNSSNNPLSTCIFYDITAGDMDVNCIADQANSTLYSCYKPSGTNGVLSTSNSSYLPAYAATTGWDFASGIGSVNAYNLVTNWNNGK